MKDVSSVINAMDQQAISSFEANGTFMITINGKEVALTPQDVEIFSEDIPGLQVANEGKLTVALDITVTDDLRYEGIAREFVNRIQNIRKDNGYDVTDKITVKIKDDDFVREAVKRHASYIGSQTLAASVTVVAGLNDSDLREVEIDDVVVGILVMKHDA